jgi:succinate-semialdehyde dehydrogenase / glutarate-semialdehyde dehydrogenase
MREGDLVTTLPLRVNTDSFIGGEWCPSSDHRTFAVVDPATTETIATVADGSVADGLAAVAAAADAADVWAATAPRERGEVLRRSFELMRERRDELAELIVLENGKSRADALAEVDYAAEFFRWFSEEAVRCGGEITTAPDGTKRILALRRPVGIAVLITPWNFPAAMATRKIGPALAAGCTVVLKPAAETPLTALALAGLMSEAGLPPGVVNVLVTARASETVAAMLAEPRVRKLSFTGSTETGRLLLRAAADQVLTCSMELGGNGPFIVFADSDLDAAVEGAMVAKMRNGGESCIAANRFLVERSILDDFAARLAERMGALRLGPGTDAEAEVGPLINLSAQEDIAKLVEASAAAGARILTGGRPADRTGWYFEPTVVTDLEPSADLLSTEIFGPVAPVLAFDDEDEAVARANDTPYGLAAYVYTSDLARGLRVAEALDAGMVGVNRGLISDPAAPFGGVKQSGLGREGGHEGLMEYLETKYVAVDW